MRWGFLFQNKQKKKKRRRSRNHLVRSDFSSFSFFFFFLNVLQGKTPVLKLKKHSIFPLELHTALFVGNGCYMPVKRGFHHVHVQLNMYIPSLISGSAWCILPNPQPSTI